MPADKTIGLDYLLAPGAEAMALIVSCGDAIGLHSKAEFGFHVFPSFADRAGSASYYNPAAEWVTALAAPHWAPGGDWRWGGLIGKNGQALFICPNGEYAYVGGEAEGETGCCMWAGIERDIDVGETVSQLFFVVPGEGEEDGERLKVWSEFTELP